jgi:hypothetical protein
VLRADVDLCFSCFETAKKKKGSIERAKGQSLGTAWCRIRSEQRRKKKEVPAKSCGSSWGVRVPKDSTQSSEQNPPARTHAIKHSPSAAQQLLRKRNASTETTLYTVSLNKNKWRLPESVTDSNESTYVYNMIF